MTLKARVCVSLAFAASAVLFATTAFAQCKIPNVPTQSMSAVVAEGGWLASDGRGAYVDGTQGSTATLRNIAYVATNDGMTVNRNSRFLVFNFNSPVVGDPLAQALGVVQDRHGEMNVFYKLDPAGADGLRQKHGLEEVPDDGVFYTSERTDLYVEINGVRHLLMFGGNTWGINTCEPSNGAIFGAPGTTYLQVARLPGSNTYLLQAPAGSLGRLFDYSNTFNPIDKGLYRFSFLITLSPKPKKGNK